MEGWGRGGRGGRQGDKGMGGWGDGEDNLEITFNSSLLTPNYSGLQLGAIQAQPHPILRTPLSLLRRGEGGEVQYLLNSTEIRYIPNPQSPMPNPQLPEFNFEF